MNKNIIIGLLIVILIGSIVYAGTSLTTANDKITKLESDYNKIDNTLDVNADCTESKCWVYPDVNEEEMEKDMFEIIKLQQTKIEELEQRIIILENRK